MTTTNLAEFGSYELQELGQLLIAYGKGKYNHPYFSDNGVHGVFNKNSGFVFLSDDDFNVLMLNENNLEGWYNLPYSGEEGFFNDLIELYEEDWHPDDKEFLINLANDLNKEFMLPSTLTKKRKK